MRWLAPGLRVKRWLLLTCVGALVILVGLAILNRAQPFNPFLTADRLLDWLKARFDLTLPDGQRSVSLAYGVIGAGSLLLLFALSQLWVAVSHAVTPGASPGQVVQSFYKQSVLARGPKLVVIGGGTGLGTMLRGLKEYTTNITAVVTVADDGGSSGKLLSQLNILPPGDIRNCLAALSDSEATMTDLLQYRFRGEGTGQGLRDHSFGNLLIAAMTGISQGNFEEAVRKTGQILNIRGQVLPCTRDSIILKGEMEDGSQVVGETNLAVSPLRIKRISLDPSSPTAASGVIEAIDAADAIVIGPGSVFTSVLPNLLVPGVCAAIQRSKSVKVYICNVMTQPGETEGFTAADHVRAIEAHLPGKLFKYVLINTGMPTAELARKYADAGAVRVEPDGDRIRDMGYRPIGADFMNQTDFVRHDADKLSQAVMKLIKK